MAVGVLAGERAGRAREPRRDGVDLLRAYPRADFPDLRLTTGRN